MCDIKGCKRPPYVEVYKFNNHSWSYLCKKHYLIELKKFYNTYGFCELSRTERIKEFYWVFKYIYRDLKN